MGLAAWNAVGFQDLSGHEWHMHAVVAKALAVRKVVHERLYCLSLEQDNLHTFPETQDLALLPQGIVL